MRFVRGRRKAASRQCRTGRRSIGWVWVSWFWFGFWLVESFADSSHRKKQRPPPIGLAAKFIEEILRLVGKQKIGKRPRSGVIGLRELRGIGFHDDERTPHHRVALDQYFHAFRIHLPGLR